MKRKCESKFFLCAFYVHIGIEFCTTLNDTLNFRKTLKNYNHFLWFYFTI